MKSVVIVGEAWGDQEAKKGEPFVGPSGRFLHLLMSACGIDKRDCHLTNVFNFQPTPSNNILNLCGPASEGIKDMPYIAKGKYIRAEYKPELTRLYREINSHNPNLIIALGGTATWALAHTSGIKKIRGAPLTAITGHKLLPTYHPSVVLRDFKLKPVIWADLNKAAKELTFPEIRRPVREFWLAPTLDDLAKFERYILESKLLSADIETYGQQITCIGFAPDPQRALVIPFVAKAYPGQNYWTTLKEELQAWDYVRKWFKLGIPLVGQNFNYDMSYTWRKYGLKIEAEVEDTMLLHHAKEPEMEKSLGFLGSLYTNEPSWKFMRTASTLKKED